MSQRERAELETLLKKAAEQRKRLKAIKSDLEQLDTRIGRVRAHAEGKADAKASPRKTTRKK